MRNRMFMAGLLLLAMLLQSLVFAQVRLGVSAVENEGDGVLVRQVLDGFAGHQAKLQPGDVILAIGDKKLTSLQEYSDAVDAVKEGTQFTVRKEDGRVDTITIHFGGTTEEESALELVPEVSGEGTTHILIFAPNQFDNLRHSSEFQNGMRLLEEQFKNSGVSERNIVVLHGRSGVSNRLGLIENLRRELETLASVPQQDRVLFFALTHGIHVNGNDFLADQKSSSDGFLQGRESELVSVREIVDTLGKSAAGHRLIVIDSAALVEPVDGYHAFADEKFGTSPIPALADNLIVLFNRSRTIYQAYDENYTCSVFVRSFLNAVSTEDLSAREEKHVSFLQALHAVTTFLRSEDQLPPWLNGTVGNDAILLPSRVDAVGLKPVPGTWRISVGQRVETAAKLIFLYHAPRDAFELLRQIEQQLESLPDAHIREEQLLSYPGNVKTLQRIARGMRGELDAVWQESRQDGAPLYLYVVDRTNATPTNLYGRLVRVTEMANGNVDFDLVALPTLSWQNDAIKMNFARVSGTARLPGKAFILGDASPVSAHLEGQFGKRPSGQ